MPDRPKEPPHGQEYIRWRLEDIARRMESQEGELRGVRENTAEIKGELKGITKKVGWMCERVSAVGEDVEEVTAELSGRWPRVRLRFGPGSDSFAIADVELWAVR